MRDDTRNRLFRIALDAVVRGDEQALDDALADLGTRELALLSNVLDTLRGKSEARRTVLLRESRRA